MARGGYRAGAGRPKGSKTVRASAISADLQRAAKKSGMTPLEYMLSVMNNPKVDQSRRDRMAVAAAPFCHPRVADNRFGKKDAAAEAAETEGEGTPWADLLGPRVRVKVN
jgi:hypothetical protein